MKFLSQHTGNEKHWINRSSYLLFVLLIYILSYASNTMTNTFSNLAYALTHQPWENSDIFTYHISLTTNDFHPKVINLTNTGVLAMCKTLN